MSSITDSLPAPLSNRLSGEDYAIPKLAALVGLVLFPFVTPWSYSTVLMSRIMILALFALSYEILIGYTGLVSFGHSLPYGLGGYAITIAMVENDVSFLTAAALALVLVVVVSVVVGALSLQLSGIYFAIITLAFAQLTFMLAIQFSDITGGSDGIPGMPRPDFLSQLGLTSQAAFYFYVFAILLVSYLVIRHLLRSPFGRIFQGIRENEQRIKLLGINTYRYKVASFVLAGVFAGIAGILHVQYLGYTGPGMLSWTVTGDVLFVTIIGGVGTLIGPIVGAAFLLLFEYGLGEILHPEAGRLVVGVVFVLVILYLRGGIVGLLRGRAVQKRLESVREKFR